jgi:hypothetical protein
MYRVGGLNPDGSLDCFFAMNMGWGMSQMR